MSFAEAIDWDMLPRKGELPPWEGPASAHGTCRALIEASSIAPWISTLIVASIAITIAWFVNTQRTANHATHKSFLWGYFIAFSGGLDGAWIFLCHLRLAACLNPTLNLMMAIYGATLFYFSYAAYKRSKIGWIGASVLSLNPIWWVINYLYARDRWKGFNNDVPFPPSLAFWQPVQARLKQKKFRDQHKLLYQNLNASKFLAEYFTQHHAEEVEVIKHCKDTEERAVQLGAKADSAVYLDPSDLVTLIADNKEARRLFGFTPTANIKSFDSMFLPILGWERYCKLKLENASKRLYPQQ